MCPTVVKLLDWGVGLGSSQRQAGDTATTKHRPCRTTEELKWKGRGERAPACELHSDAEITSPGVQRQPTDFA